MDSALKIKSVCRILFGGGTLVQNWDSIIHRFSCVITLAVLAGLRDVIVRNLYVVNVCYKHRHKHGVVN